jgi:hypothetical protein
MNKSVRQFSINISCSVLQARSEEKGVVNLKELYLEDYFQICDAMAQMRSQFLGNWEQGVLLAQKPVEA